MPLSQFKIPSNWEISEFSKIAELRHGYQFRNYDYTEKGIRIFKITQIKANGSIDLSACSFIDSNRISQFDRIVLNKGDILMALTGATIGKIARFNSDELVLQNYRVGNFFSQDEKILSKDFLYHFLRSDYFFNQLLARQTQSAQQNIGKDDINNMSVFLPPITEQHAIASILSALDDKIENNLAMNRTLEEMAMALYNHWFVDFGQFQDGKFVPSELGDIPEGWETKGLLEITDLLTGGTPKTKVEEYWNGNIPWVSAKDLANSGSIYTTSTERTISEKGLKHSAAKILPEDSVIIVARGSVGKLGMIAKPMAINQSCFGLNSNGGDYSPGLIYLLITRLVDRFQRISYGSVFDTITTSSFSTTKIVCPPSALVKELASLIDPMFLKIKQNTIENETLTNLRDTILPKLINGEVRLKEFEETIANVL